MGWTIYRIEIILNKGDRSWLETQSKADGILILSEVRSKRHKGKKKFNALPPDSGNPQSQSLRFLSFNFELKIHNTAYNSQCGYYETPSLAFSFSQRKLSPPHRGASMMEALPSLAKGQEQK